MIKRPIQYFIWRLLRSDQPFVRLMGRSGVFYAVPGKYIEFPAELYGNGNRWTHVEVSVSRVDYWDSPKSKLMPDELARAKDEIGRYFVSQKRTPITSTFV